MTHKLALFSSASIVAIAWAMPPVVPEWWPERGLWEHASRPTTHERSTR